VPEVPSIDAGGGCGSPQQTTAPASWIAQLYFEPAAIAFATLASPFTEAGGSVWPRWSMPQQMTTALLVWIAQATRKPTLIAAAPPVVPFTDSGGSAT
jgi:hypothetical protein